MGANAARALVFITSALVLVLEIVAGRIVAPYVGISLESFTGVIGTMLAGIAAGAAIGGYAADNADPDKLLGPTIAIGGVLAWLSLPIARALGPALGASGTEAVFLVACAFFLPAAVVSAASPMVAKMTLHSVEETGAVVGGLSAAGTAGALVGTFVTGFVLISVLSNTAIIAGVGAALVALGVGLMWFRHRDLPTLPGVGAAAVGALVLVGSNGVCDYETTYYCARIEVEADAPNERSLWLDQLRHGSVNLDDPTDHDIRYVRILAGVADSLPEGPIDAIHIGGGAFSTPAHVAATRPGSTQLVLEIDDELVDIAEDQLGLEVSDNLQVRVGDGRLALADLETDSYDLVIGDAFGGEAVPWHLTTSEVAAELDRMLGSNGVYAMNILDGPRGRFGAAMMATLGEHFDHLAVVQPPEQFADRRFVNRIVLASDEPLPVADIDASDGTIVRGDPWGDGRVLTDDHAPVDQLVD